MIVRILMLVCVLLSLTSCSLHKMDWPSADVWEHWQKPGLTKSEVGRYLVDVCGYKLDSELRLVEPNLDAQAFHEYSMSRFIKTEECMLANGFIYVDEPDGYVGGACKFPKYQNLLPSCRSLHQPQKLLPETQNSN